MSAHGGKRTGAGRKKGSENKTTAEIRALAQQHGEMAIVELARLVKKASNDQTRIAAAKELLDRGYGKSTQPLQHEGDTRPVFHIITGVTEPEDNVTSIATGVERSANSYTGKLNGGSNGHTKGN